MTSSQQPSVPASSTRQPRKRAIVAGLLIAAALAGWWLLTPAEPPAGKAGPGPRGSFSYRMEAVPVRVVPVEQQALPVYLSALGTVTSLNTVLVRSRVDGELIEVAFEEGQHVDAGDLLARIDPRPYEVALAEAEGQQQQNLALLENARSNLELYRGLWEQDSIARQELDNQEALFRQYQGTVQIDQARVDEARLQLSFTRITAPVSGRLGLRKVDPGNLIGSGDSEGLVVITQMDPISVRFHLPEADLPAVLEQVRNDGPLRVEAWNRSSTGLLAVGTLRTLDNLIDTTTGTITLKAQFDNPLMDLFPNQFVNVRLRLDTLEDATVIPTAAIQYGSRGTFVYVIDDEDKAQLRTIEQGPSSGEHTAIISGLQPGELVVLEGIDRLRAGTPVTMIAEPVVAERESHPVRVRAR